MNEEVVRAYANRLAEATNQAIVLEVQLREALQRIASLEGEKGGEEE